MYINIYEKQDGWIDRNTIMKKIDGWLNGQENNYEKNRWMDIKHGSLDG